MSKKCWYVDKNSLNLDQCDEKRDSGLEIKEHYGMHFNCEDCGIRGTKYPNKFGVKYSLCKECGIKCEICLINQEKFISNQKGKKMNKIHKCTHYNKSNKMVRCYHHKNR